MAIKEPLLDLNIETEKSGFYQGFSKFVTVGSKISIGALILWAVTQPETAGEVLKAVRSSIDNNTGPWYMYVMAFYILVCFGLAIWPATGKIRLGGDGSRPEFSSFSWFSMMFGLWSSTSRKLQHSTRTCQTKGNGAVPLQSSQLASSIAPGWPGAHLARHAL